MYVCRDGWKWDPRLVYSQGETCVNENEKHRRARSVCTCVEMVGSGIQGRCILKERLV